MHLEKPTQEQLNTLLEYYKNGQYVKAEKLSVSITQEFPDHQFAWKILGATFKQDGRIRESLVASRKSLQINPQDASSHNNLGVVLQELKKINEAEASYRKAIELKPDYVEAHSNLGNIMKELGRLNEAEASYRKAIKLKPDFLGAHYNLGNTLTSLKKLDEAVVSYKKVIELKLNFPEVYYNLGNVLTNLERLDEAVASYKKAIELKPDYAEAYNNLGLASLKYKKIDEAERNYKKATELSPDYTEAHNNLKIIIRLKELLYKIDEFKNTEKKNNINQISENNLNSNIKEILNPFISNRTVEKELVNKLYKIKATELSQMKTGPLFGSGRTSNFFLFEEDSLIIKNLEKDLIKIMSEVVKSEVCVVDSFFNIINKGAGSKFHTHLVESDISYGLSKKKYSLQYYLSVGDQNCNEPGFFEMKDPDEKILPSNGMIIIIPSDRLHSAIYSGKADRVMIGVNFYSLI